MAARPFRRALYTSVVRETFPIWNNGKCDWVDDIVYPLTDADPETDPIIIATALLQEVDGEYDERHAGAALLMGCELAAFARGTSMLRELERTGSADKPADWKVASLTRNASVILERVKDETATAKALIPYDNANAIVKRYLMDKNADVRTLAVKALGKISTRDGLIGGRYSIEDTVVKSLKDDHLEGVEAGKVIDAIAERFKFDVDENVRRGALAALRNLGKLSEHVDAIVECMHCDMSPRMRWVAYRALEKLGHGLVKEPAYNSMTEFLKGEKPLS
ncbi:hypothetical protein CYMTET_22172 [Cymbomonas tetramitiformis]|uniref:HEAT repeat domain-containing protein n=1 Tax=Cymbomonas tetramitiformis TaxID=36881 RepID=A0AAE0G1D9_9CHLO|nr:hypothetical protein CYMTET_22172 [Cymbomonas tetramitiformis]